MGDESDGDGGDNYLEKDDNDENEDDDLDKSEYENSDIVSGTGVFQLSKSRTKERQSNLKLKNIIDCSVYN